MSKLVGARNSLSRFDLFDKTRKTMHCVCSLVFVYYSLL